MIPCRNPPAFRFSNYKRVVVTGFKYETYASGFNTACLKAREPNDFRFLIQTLGGSEDTEIVTIRPRNRS